MAKKLKLNYGVETTFDPGDGDPVTVTPDSGEVGFFEVNELAGLFTCEIKVTGDGVNLSKNYTFTTDDKTVLFDDFRKAIVKFLKTTEQYPELDSNSWVEVDE